MLKKAFHEPKFLVCCLGSFKLVEAGSGTDMTPTGRKTRALIGYLCIVRKPIGRERLASLLWGDRGDEQARASLRQAIYEVRSMLGGDRLLRMERDTVAIGEDVGTDMAAITAAAQSGDLQQLSHALSEWRGDFFEDLPSIDETFDTWLQAERHRVQENLIHAAVEAANAGLAGGEIEPARRIVNQLQQRDGTNEIVLRLGLKLDHIAGDSAALRRRYERFRELLKAELGAAPAAETQRLFQDLTANSAAAAETIALDSRNNVTDGTNECAQPAAHPEGPPAKPSTSEADVEPPISQPLARSGRWIRISGAAFAVASLCALAWAVWGPLQRAAPPSVANVSPTVAAERRLLSIDTYSEQTTDRVAEIEKAARTAAQRALALDPNDKEALGVLAVLTPSTQLQEIDRLFERALRSEPDDPQLLNWHGKFLLMVGRGHGALQELTRAYERDRAASTVAPNLALAFMVTGGFEQAWQIIGPGPGDKLREEFLPLRVKYFLYRRDWFGLENDLRALPDDISPPKAAFFRLCRETALAFVAREADRFGPLRVRWRTETSVDPDDAVQFLSALGDDNGALAVVQSVVQTRRNHDLLTDPGWDALFGPNLAALRRDPRVAALFAQWGLSGYWRTENRSPDFMR
ncbi:MAG TPA: BTAD domain-containing putative transcriptional regulator [Rhizomicrobium sp.]